MMIVGEVARSQVRPAARGRRHILPGLLACLLVACLLGAPAVQAQPAADFYHGKTLNMLVGVGVGGEFDLLARLMAKYLARHLPGSPVAVTQNVPGASGMKALNYLYNQAPRDGTYVELVQPSLPAAQAAGLPGVQFDAARLIWLGTIAPSIENLVLWHTTGVRDIAQARARELVIGATSKGSNTYAFPALMNDFLGTRFKIVTGYTAGSQINIAMERGEVEGRTNSWASWKTTKPDWLRDRKIVVIARAGRAAPDLDAPSLEELAGSAEARRIIALVLSGGPLGRPFAVPPGVPPQRVVALRGAFDAAMQDADFLAEMAALNFDVAPVDGAALQKIATDVVDTPKGIAARAKPFLE
jgi:tripartite-type tricarboxylate transporter receptor subunit TctC